MCLDLVFLDCIKKLFGIVSTSSLSKPYDRATSGRWSSRALPGKLIPFITNLEKNNSCHVGVPSNRSSIWHMNSMNSSDFNARIGFQKRFKEGGTMLEENAIEQIVCMIACYGFQRKDKTTPWAWNAMQLYAWPEANY